MNNIVPSQRRRNTLRAKRGFTLIELVTVIVILGVLSAVAMPVYLDYKGDAAKAACRGSLGAMRSAIGSYQAWKATDAGGGAAAFPTVTELGALGTVMADTLPFNPYDTDTTKNNIVDATGQAKGTVIGSTGGWAYNPSNGQLWANTSTKSIGENNF